MFAVHRPPEASTRGAANPIHDRPPLRVLLIDDQEDQFVLVRGLLRPFSEPPYEVTWHATYSGGLIALRGGGYDICIVDFRLGQMDGIDLIREAISAGVTTPCILMTGRGDRQVDMRAMAAGAIDYLPKGEISAGSLERTIRYATTNQRLVAALSRSRGHLAALEEVSRAMAVSGPTRDGFSATLDVIADQLGYGRSAIYLLRGDRLVLTAERGVEDPIEAVLLATGPVGRIVAERRATIIPNWTEAGTGVARGCEYTLPLEFDGSTIGLLAVGVVDDRAVDEEDQTALLEIAARLASACGIYRERAGLAERSARLTLAAAFASGIATHLPGTEESDTILSGIGDAFEADGFALAMPGPEGMTIRAARGSLGDRVGRRIAEPRSAAARALEAGTVQVDSTGTSCAAFAPMPMAHGTGLLWVDRRGLTAAYSPVDIQALALLGLEAGTGLAIDEERHLVESSGIVDPADGLYRGAFLEAFLRIHGAVDAGTVGEVGMVLAGPLAVGRLTASEQHELVDGIVLVARRQIGGGPDLLGHDTSSPIAVLVRERAAERTPSIAAAIAALGSTSELDEVAVGWAVRPIAELVGLLPAARMAIELSRRSHSTVQG